MPTNKNQFIFSTNFDFLTTSLLNYQSKGSKVIPPVNQTNFVFGNGNSFTFGNGNSFVFAQTS